MSNAYAPLDRASGAGYPQLAPFAGQAFNAAGQPVPVAVPVAAYPLHGHAFPHASAPMYAPPQQQVQQHQSQAQQQPQQRVEWVQMDGPQYQQQAHQQQPNHSSYPGHAHPAYAPLQPQYPQLNAHGQHAPVNQFAVSAAPVTMGQPGHVARGQWSDGLCSFLSALPICLVSTFILPLRWAQTVQRVQLKSFGAALALFGIPWLLPFILSFALDGLTMRGHGSHRRPRDLDAWMWGALVAPAILCNLIVIYLGAKYRGKLRSRFAIPGSAFEDCLAHAFCRCCAVAQEARHVDRDFAFPI